MKDKLVRIIAEQLSVDDIKIRPESNFTEDLGADSLDLIELIMAVEEEFDIFIRDEEAEKIKTVQDVLDYLDKTGANQSK